MSSNMRSTDSRFFTAPNLVLKLSHRAELCPSRASFHPFAFTHGSGHLVYWSGTIPEFSYPLSKISREGSMLSVHNLQHLGNEVR
jgi:hypothetical protein